MVAEKPQTLNPFGAEITPEGVRFRLWAPKARSVDVHLKTFLPMQSIGDGWFECLTPEAKAGTLYRYRIDGEHLVPDPASRFQPQDVDGPSEVIDPAAFRWKESWKGRPWREAVIYELHVGTFTPEGTYAGVVHKLNHLKETGITAIELMPLADFAGRRNWGYDGVLPYAPDSAYGRPEDLKALVQAAHEAGLMIFLDVVYNHFGPKGNYLNLYAPQFFTERHKTPWGAAIDFSQPAVRRYFVNNVLHWLLEYRFDGLRFDAVHAIHDDSPRHILDEICDAAPEGKHLVLENDANQARFIGPGKYDAQWNDDSHHGYHVLACGEDDGYYVAYADAPAKHLARCLAEGFAYQGEVSPFSKEARGEPSGRLPPSCFVDFLQNHDQIGNRAMGERLLSLANEKQLKALSAIQLLAPSPPLLFMGEEWGCRQPFLFFCDFDGELGEAVRKGRREEFSRFAAFKERIPDPLAETTFRRSVLRWKDRDAGWLTHYRDLLALRKKEIIPLECGPGRYRMLGERAFEVTWDRLTLIANCGDDAVSINDVPSSEPLWSNGAPGGAWTVNWWK
ncbi:MAG: maltooligosyltrehalose trehalohydrolase [Betaproteobacteria bacterium]|jgi:malto-oligosyltrehalose trehalohydrolase|nr:maltooligosyltrehalose trehalohydrolase [Betaproteobacteria bacterium]